MKIINKENKNKFILKGFFEEEKLKVKNLLTTFGAITEDINKQITYICLGSNKKFDRNALKKIANKIIKLNIRELQIIAKSFITKDLDLQNVVNIFIDTYEYINGEDLYSAKTTKNEKSFPLFLVIENNKVISESKQTLIISQLVNKARKYQATPPNICNSEWLAQEFNQMFKNSKKVKVKVLNKDQIEKEKMNLFLSVNKGSAFEPRLVVVEYNGNLKSKEKVALIGKGITFDSGGYNLKPSQHIKGMKFDMSGAAICAAAMKGIIDLNAKANVCMVLPLTDNKISSNAQTPDSIWTAMNGKTVEVNNTDAEGRLILADAITYAIKYFNPTQIIDIATLTGAIIISLGTTYTGIWSTCEKSYNKFLMAANKQDELIWRMPFHEDFLKNIKSANFSDYKNTDLSGKGGSISAAMFLKEFTENKKYIHLDIAGTAGDGDNPTGVMVKTLIQFALDFEN